jgi:hypothetical protein
MLQRNKSLNSDVFSLRYVSSAVGGIQYQQTAAENVEGANSGLRIDH